MKKAAHALYAVVSSILGIPLVVLIPIVTGLLGILAAIPLVGAVVLLCCSLVWMAVAAVICLCSAVAKIPVIGDVFAFAAIPVAVAGECLIALLPSMGEKEAKESKRLFAFAWPFSLDFMRAYLLRKKDVDTTFLDTTFYDSLPPFGKTVMDKLRYGLPLDERL